MPARHGYHVLWEPLPYAGGTVYASTWNEAITALMTGGLTFAEATLWALEWSFQHDGEWLAAKASEYRDAGFSAAEGFTWFFCLTEPDEAVAWATAGWRPLQVVRMRKALGDLSGPPHWKAGEGVERVLSRWRATGIPPWRCVRYARAGVGPGEAPVWEARRAAGEDLGRSLDLLTALRK